MRAILAHHMWRGHDSLPSPNRIERFGWMRRPLRHTPIRNRCDQYLNKFYWTHPTNLPQQFYCKHVDKGGGEGDIAPPR